MIWSSAFSAIGFGTFEVCKGTFGKLERRRGKKNIKQVEERVQLDNKAKKSRRVCSVGEEDGMCK